MEAQAMFAFPGVITYVTGESGVVKHVTHDRYGETTGVIVRLDERPCLMYVTLGLRAITCTCGADALRREHHHEHCDLMSNLSTLYREVLAVREIDRDEFDQLTGIASLRSEFGWDIG